MYIYYLLVKLSCSELLIYKSQKCNPSPIQYHCLSIQYYSIFSYNISRMCPVLVNIEQYRWESFR